MVANQDNKKKSTLLPMYVLTTRKTPCACATPQQLIQEIELKSIQAQQQITMVRSQQAARQREMRLAQLTRSEISSLPADTPVYEGLGKMYGVPPIAHSAVLSTSAWVDNRPRA